MNILLINHYAGSPKHGMEFRPFFLAKEWQKQGHKVLIVAASFSHLRTQNKKLSVNFLEETIDGVNYLWIKTPEYASNGVGRMMNIAVFLYRLKSMLSTLINRFKPDAVIASSTYPSDNYIARAIAKKAKAQHIYEVHDLWPLSPMEIGGMSKHHPFVVLMQHAENYAYKHADKVVSILPNTKQHMISHGLAEQKWHYIPNGIVPDDWDNAENLSPDIALQLNSYKQQGKTILGYAGGHALSNSLHTIIEAAEILIDQTQLVFVLVGKGQEKSNLQQKAAHLPNVRFFDAIPKKQVPKLLQLFDITLITWNKSPLYRFGISPNKVFDYMMAARPIIHAVDAPNKFVDEARCGLAISPESPQELAKAIVKLAALSATEKMELGHNGKRYVLQNHSYSLLARNFIQFLEK